MQPHEYLSGTDVPGSLAIQDYPLFSRGIVPGYPSS